MTRPRLILPRLSAAALGGGALVALVAWLGARQIGAQVAGAAWTLPACLAIHAAQLWLSALAWRGLCGRPRPGPVAWWRIRWVREAVNAMLPVAQIGGNIAAVRLLAARGVGQARAAAATVLDVTVEAAAQAAFTLAGIAVLAAVSPDRRWVPWLAGGGAALCLGVAGFAAAQRFGLLRLVEAGAARLRRRLPRLDLRGLQAAFVERRRDLRALSAATSLHLLAWLLGVAETWIVLAAIGPLPGAAAAFCIESLGMAARSAGFVVPGALGVQEAGFVLVAGLFGVPPGTAVALSMVKRARELLVGVPGLLVWQGSEGVWRRRKEPAGVAPRSDTERR